MSQIKKIGLVDFLRLSHLKIGQQSDTSSDSKSNLENSSNIDVSQLTLNGGSDVRVSPTNLDDGSNIDVSSKNYGAPKIFQDSSLKESATSNNGSNMINNSLPNHVDGEINHNFSHDRSTHDRITMESGGRGPGGFRMRRPMTNSFEQNNSEKRLPHVDKSQSRVLNEDDKSENILSPAKSPREFNERKRMPPDSRVTMNGKDAGVGDDDYQFNRMRSEGDRSDNYQKSARTQNAEDRIGDKRIPRGEGMDNRRDNNRGEWMDNRRDDNRGEGMDNRRDNNRGEGMDNRRDNNRREGMDNRRDNNRDEGMDNRRDDNQGEGMDNRRDNNRGEGMDNRRDNNRGEGMDNRRYNNRGEGMDNRRYNNRGEGMDNRRYNNRGEGMDNRRDNNQGEGMDNRRDNNRGEETDNRRINNRGDGLSTRRDNNRGDRNAGWEEGKFEVPRPAPVTYIPPDLDESEDKLFEGIRRGENFEKFGEYNVEVTGESVPNYSIDRFEDAKVIPTIMNNIMRAGYTCPTPIQKWAIPIILEGRDMMACAQTGSGKTAAFLIPVLSRIVCADDWLMKASMSSTPTPLVLILSPTRELAIQTHRECRKFAYETIVSATCVYGGVEVHHQLGQLQRRCHVVVATVGRIGDFVKTGRVDLSQVRYLILDEADRMLDLGFNTEVTSIIEKCGGLKNKDRQTLLFSATFPVEIQELAGKILNNYIFVTIGSVGQANRDIKQIVRKVDKKKKREMLMDVLKEIGTEKVIVFVQTKRMVDALCISLSEFMDIPMTAIHGDLDQKEREEVLGYFREGTATVLMATSVAARGLDINNVKHVINYDLPSSIDEYIHRIGRTARCGHVGRALSFFSEIDDAPIARPLIKILSDARQEVPSWLEEFASSSVGVGGFHKDPTTTRDARKNGQVPPSGRGRGFRQNQPPPPSKHSFDQGVEDEDYWA